MGLGGEVFALVVNQRRIMGGELVGIGMSNLLSPVVAGAGLGFGVVFLMAIANGLSGLVFNRSITETVTGRLGGSE